MQTRSNAMSTISCHVYMTSSFATNDVILPCDVHYTHYNPKYMASIHGMTFDTITFAVTSKSCVSQWHNKLYYMVRGIK